MSIAIEARGIVKRFRTFHLPLFWKSSWVPVLNDVSFQIPIGACWAIVGPNGAGKTTLLKILAGLIAADAGTLSLDARRVRFISGDERSFYWRLTARQNLQFFARLNGLSDAQTQERVAAFSNEWELRSCLDRPFEELSTGMRQRLGIVRAQLSEGAILLADEPARSLDASSKEKFYRWAKRWTKQENRTLLLTTHHPDEVRPLADAVRTLEGGVLRG
jgi:ABC-2 type transport system ATP-binding protein